MFALYQTLILDRAEYFTCASRVPCPLGASKTSPCQASRKPTTSIRPSSTYGAVRSLSCTFLVPGVPQGLNPPEKLGRLRQIIDRMLKEEGQSSSIIMGSSITLKLRHYLPARNHKLFPLATGSFHDLHLCKLGNVPESEVKEYRDT
jgi:hypothetical protein